jgi:hypothetical protein
LTEFGKTPNSAASLREATPTSIIPTPRGHRCGHFPHVVQRQISSFSISVMPNAAWRTNLRMLKVRTLFHGQTVSHIPH